MNTLKAVHLLAAGALLALTSLAQAQYIWIDAKGMKQFSDQAPPGNVPASKILKAPGRAKFVIGAPDEAAPQAASASAAPASLLDREADYRKRKKEKADADAKAAATASNLAQRQAACNSARVRNSELASGKRIRGADNGVLDDAARAAQQESTNQALAACN